MIPRMSAPVRVGAPARSFSPVSSGISRSPGQLRGANLGRQGKYDIRAAKRWGGIDLFGVPLPLLWLEQGCVPNLLQPYACTAQPIVNLWP